MGDWFSRPVNHLHGRLLPEPGIPAGYAALMERYDLAVPPPPLMAAISARHRRQSHPSWQLLTPRHRPADSLAGQLVFALKWEGVDLGVLAGLFKVVEPEDVAAVVRTTPTGSFARRIWFLYEWLTGRELDAPSPGKVRMVPVVDTEQQVALPIGTPSPRHKVIDNLPGGPRFCPMIRWTPTLRATAAMRLDATAREIVGKTRQDLVTRAAAFLLLSDSKSSFAIEGEQPTGARATRWAQAIGEAGTRVLSIDELERLQGIIIGDARFVRPGLRVEGGFVGSHDRHTHEPLPEHISARPQDLPSLVNGVIDYAARSLGRGADPVAAAAALAFGFVYVHPFVDGNGRLHRWLVHHALATAGYTPPGIVFPISAVMLKRIDEYSEVLESYSARLLPFVDWQATAGGNVDVRNDTADYYRYFDATRHAEFLYACVAHTVDHDLPAEVRFLEAFDAFSAAVKDIVEMPDRDVDRLRGFLAQGDGRLSQRARTREFGAFTDAEVATVEGLYAECFGGLDRRNLA